jgi:ATP-dependent RNA helicase RhlE
VAEAAPEEAPAKKRRRRKKSGAAAAAPEEPAAQTAAPAPDTGRTRSAGGRGLRHGKLEDTLPSDPSMPVTDFYKPNPLDADTILDATARLLAPRRTAAHGKAAPAKGKRELPPESKSQRREKQARKQESRSVLPPSLAGKRKRRRDDRPRPVEAPPRADRQKDSTQQKSLMRPYYLNHDD